MALFSFLELPPELILKILSTLDGKALLTCEPTCRRLQDTIRGSSELQYIIMLSAFGMCDGASAHIPAEERLRKLGAHQSAWRDGKFTEAATMALSDSIEVSGNVIVSISRDTRRRLLVHQVPSPLRGIAAREWEVNLPFDVFHFLVDAAQDLLLVLEGAFSSNARLHRLHLSTGEPHGDAIGARAREFVHFDASMSRRSWKIQGDYVRIAITTSQNMTEIWNWRTGVCEAQVGLRTLSGDDGIAFLDDRHIIGLWCPEPNEMVLAVHAFRRDSDADTPTPILIGSLPVALFGLPSLTHERVFLERRLEVGEATLQWPESAPTQDAGLFDTDSADRLVSVRFETELGVLPPRRAIFEVLIPISGLVPHIAKGSEALLPWKAWGPDGALLHQLPTYYATAFYGLRAAYKTIGHFQIVDFHRGHVDRMLGRDVRVGTSGMIIDEPFADGPINTALPHTTQKVLEGEPRKFLRNIFLGEDMLLVPERARPSVQGECILHVFAIGG